MTRRSSVPRLLGLHNFIPIADLTDVIMKMMIACDISPVFLTELGWQQHWRDDNNGSDDGDNNDDNDNDDDDNGDDNNDDDDDNDDDANDDKEDDFSAAATGKLPVPPINQCNSTQLSGEHVTYIIIIIIIIITSSIVIIVILWSCTYYDHWS